MKEHDAADVNDPGWLLSALADGEAGAAELDQGCRLWAATASVRQCWHDYHLIGDVLRSQDLASQPRHDQDFIRRLSARLDVEPAVLAPAPLSRTAPPRRRWAVPAALAASVMALGTVVAVWSNLEDPAAAVPLAAAPAATVPPVAAAPATAAPAAAAQAAVAADEGVPAGARLVRDARLDRYLRAHRDYAVALPGSLPGGSARSIATVSFER